MDKHQNSKIESQIANLNYLENVYDHYQAQREQLDSSWGDFFREFDQDTPSFPTRERFVEGEIDQLIEAYRRYGHLQASVNPISLTAVEELSQLKLENFGLNTNQGKDLFPTRGLLSKDQASLNEIVEILKKRYCGTIGFDFKGFTDKDVESWIQQQIESGRMDSPLSIEEKLVILDVLTRAEILETFLHTKHVGKKRFSLEGGESLIPLLVMMIGKASTLGVEEIFMGMSHRGRLNVLANILNKPILTILKEFDEDYIPDSSEGTGDIRYHKGHTNESIHTYVGKSIKIHMAPNPSHLESVNAVIEGQTHAKQFLVGDETDRNRIIPLLLHGDAALAGQGIVYETLQMGKLAGFETGGTIHVAVNNQVGFTASPQEGRSTIYCTDISHTFGAPVFHVNAEDPEACVKVALFALDIRQKFHCDVFIDLNCYRKYGHNEGDEPAYTQPQEYQIIRKKKSIRQMYFDQLLQEGFLDKGVAEEREENLKKMLQEAYQLSQEQAHVSQHEKKSDHEKGYSFQPVDTGVDLSLLKKITESFSKIPSDFQVHPKLGHLIKEREKAVEGNLSIDWGLAEFLAYGSLLWEGIPVRLSGQDSGRGTFSHRHALWVDQSNYENYYPLANLRDGQGRFEVLNSCLSEAAALGFEYGYSTICSKGLTIWEAQFGDFVNSAQVIIDQYIASSEQKWNQNSNLVLFLPHGFEGQGPEHSSARFERFLTLAGHDNMQIVNPTTPAQLFHLLRRQVKQPYLKPLVVLTPKGLLRFPACVSPLKDFTQGHFFQLFLDDFHQPKKIERLILCSGRIFYDLEARREKEKRENLAIIRLEQLYPLDIQLLKSMISRYGDFKECLWVQDEPENMGAWHYISYYLPQILPKGIPFYYIGRERSASPATGFYARHKQELADILDSAFGNNLSRHTSV